MYENDNHCFHIMLVLHLMFLKTCSNVEIIVHCTLSLSESVYSAIGFKRNFTEEGNETFFQMSYSQLIPKTAAAVISKAAFSSPRHSKAVCR